MIKSYADKETRKVREGTYSKKLPDDIQERGLDKLFMIESAKDLRDLKTPPGNRLEKLTGDRRGQYAIRINNQWRICFDWHEGDAYSVEIVDYH